PGAARVDSHYEAVEPWRRAYSVSTTGLLACHDRNTTSSRAMRRSVSRAEFGRVTRTSRPESSATRYTEASPRYAMPRTRPRVTFSVSGLASVLPSGDARVIEIFSGRTAAQTVAPPAAGSCRSTLITQP